MISIIIVSTMIVSIMFIGVRCCLLDVHNTVIIISSRFAFLHKWNLSEAGRLPVAASINPPRPGVDELPSEAYGMDKQMIAAFEEPFL